MDGEEIIRFRHNRSHRDRRDRRRVAVRVWTAVPVALLLAGAGAGAVVMLRDDGGTAAGAPQARLAAAEPAGCRPLTVLTAGSFAPVLRALAPGLRGGAPCVDLTVTVADGRAAPGRAGGADVWIPDDASWAGLAPEQALDPAAAGAGGTVAQTPIYFVAGDAKTASAVVRAGAGWLGLAGLLHEGSGVRLAVPDPASSGEGMVAAGSLGEAVWKDQDMDASAMVLATALGVTRTVPGSGPALPRRGEVGLVTERALLAAGDSSGQTVLAGADRTGLLRYTWLPTAAGAARADAAAALRSALGGPAGTAAIEDAGLRGPGGGAPAAARAAAYPAPEAGPFEPLGPHHVEHVFATWYPADRRTDLHVVVDVSSSMSAVPAGSDRQLVAVVRDGLTGLAALLPDDARVALWEFGSRLDGDADHRELVALQPLDGGRRAELDRATGDLVARRTGTGLYDTILAAYRSAVASHRDGVPDQVLVFTDGRNDDDTGSITAAELSRELAAAADPARPVALSVVAFGEAPDVEGLEKALEPVEGYVDPVLRADEVSAVFVHVAAGGPHG